MPVFDDESAIVPEDLQSWSARTYRIEADDKVAEGTACVSKLGVNVGRCINRKRPPGVRTDFHGALGSGLTCHGSHLDDWSEQRHQTGDLVDAHIPQRSGLGTVKMHGRRVEEFRSLIDEHRQRAGDLTEPPLC